MASQHNGSAATNGVPAASRRPDDYLVSTKALREDWGIPFSNVHLLRLENEGKFPRRIKLGGGKGRHSFYSSRELAAYISEQAAARDSEVVV